LVELSDQLSKTLLINRPPSLVAAFPVNVVVNQHNDRIVIIKVTSQLAAQLLSELMNAVSQVQKRVLLFEPRAGIDSRPDEPCRVNPTPISHNVAERSNDRLWERVKEGFRACLDLKATIANRLKEPTFLGHGILSPGNTGRHAELKVDTSLTLLCTLEEAQKVRNRLECDNFDSTAIYASSIHLLTMSPAKQTFLEMS
jgi:hypothetical protein